MKKLGKACTKYDKWKSKHQPSHKPWLYPEQVTVGRLNPADIGTFSAEETLTASADTGEATIGENAVQIDDLVKEE
jgi:hypothetical protein